MAQRRAAVDVIVSALTSAEENELGLADEGMICQTRRIEFFSFPIPDYGVPSSRLDFAYFAAQLSRTIKRQKSIVVHCKQGIGRATLIAAGALIGLGISAEEALAKIERARGRPVPDTEEQKVWVRSCEELIIKSV